MCSALAFLIIGAVAISATEVKEVVSTQVSYAPGPKGFAYTSSHPYHGGYSGHCGNDGFYYNDDSSFVICSNGNAYVQPCAPGSKNSAYTHYQHGNSYYYRDFCDLNLVDHGYNLKQGYTSGYLANDYRAPAHNAGYAQESYGYNSALGYPDGYRGDYSHGGYADSSYGGSYYQPEYSGPARPYGH